jgi:hypothetical protein
LELNRKLDREAFSALLDEIGGRLLDSARELANQPGPVREFLDKNPVPAPLSTHLPDEFRVFCLALNALKVWVAAEQAATDRYLLGSQPRKECRAVAKTCIVTGAPLLPGEIELHHPVRDGRPPIPLSREGHAQIENQTVAEENDGSVRSKLTALKKAGARSWVQLRRGCLDLSGKGTAHSTAKTGAGARTFARKAHEITGLNYQEILHWMDKNGK